MTWASRGLAVTPCLVLFALFQAFMLCYMEFHWDRGRLNHWPETPSFLVCFMVSSIKFYFILEKIKSANYFTTFLRGNGFWKGREKGWSPIPNDAKYVCTWRTKWNTGIVFIKGDKALEPSPWKAHLKQADSEQQIASLDLTQVQLKTFLYSRIYFR